MESSTASLAPLPGEANGKVKPYKIHVSSKYLAQTASKLELTRLPHELPSTSSSNNADWTLGTPKSAIEPLIDFWLESYDWRIQETHLNTALPQFRTALPVPIPSKGRGVPDMRVHFIHIRSSKQDAIPLLLVPSFPLTNLSLGKEMLRELAEGDGERAFHVIVPSIPGLGFSDAFSSEEVEEQALVYTAGLFDALMGRLGYEAYLVSGTGSGRESVAGIDYHLPRLIGERYKERCLGVHLLGPIVEAPRVGSGFWEWAKWRVAGFFHAGWWGYEETDWKALGEYERARKLAQKKGEDAPLLPRREGAGYGAVGMVGLREPNTFAYALCDSPVGLLSLVCSALKRKSPKHQLTNTEIIDVTQLAWLPGPEAGARFWAAAVKEVEHLEKKSVRSRVAVTVFGADGLDADGYTCPAWASRKHEVVFAQRVMGRAGLLAWERSDVLIAGIRGLAKAIEAVDDRLKVHPLEEVVVLGEEAIPEEAGNDEEDHGMQLDVESPDTVVALKLT